MRREMLRLVTPMFDDLLEANRRYAETFPHGGLATEPAREPETT